MIWKLILTVVVAVSLHSGCKNDMDDEDNVTYSLSSCQERGLVDNLDGDSCIEANYAINLDYRSPDTITIEILRHPDDGRDSPQKLGIGDPAYDKAVVVDLAWRCDGVSAHSGQTKATIAENAASVEIPLTEINIAGYRTCELKAEAVVPYIDPRDGKESTISLKTIGNIDLSSDQGNIVILGSGGDNIVLKVNNIVADDRNSTADIKISFVDGNGDLVKSGNEFFDDDVDIDILWFCARLAGWPRINGMWRDLKTVKHVLAAGRAEGTKQIQLGSDNIFGSPGVKCFVSVIADASSRQLRSAGTPFVIGSPQLDVEVIEARQGKAFAYRVLEDGAELNALVNLRLVDPLRVACKGELFFVHFPEDGTSIMYGNLFYNISSSSDNHLFLLRTDKVTPSGCGGKSLLAITGSGNSRKLGYDSAEGFHAAESPPSPFTLDKSRATVSPMRNHRGKVWVFPYDSDESSSDLVGYADINNAGGTRLKASTADDADNATLDSSKKYIVFAEVGGELQVFFM